MPDQATPDTAAIRKQQSKVVETAYGPVKVFFHDWNALARTVVRMDLEVGKVEAEERARTARRDKAA